MKSAIYKFIFGCSALAIAATACNSDEQLSLSGDRTAANISAGVGYSADNRATRAADAAWGINDHIGITMLASPPGTDCRTSSCRCGFGLQQSGLCDYSRRRKVYSGFRRQNIVLPVGWQCSDL